MHPPHYASGGRFSTFVFETTGEIPFVAENRPFVGENLRLSVLGLSRRAK